jgi:hypothetical protein
MALTLLATPYFGAGSGGASWSPSLPSSRLAWSAWKLAQAPITGRGSWFGSVRFGHTVRLIPPQYVKPYVKRNKTDAADAEAICEAVG